MTETGRPEKKYSIFSCFWLNLHNGAELECRPRDLFNASEGNLEFLGAVEHNVLMF